jgi:hypothetical protein
MRRKYSRPERSVIPGRVQVRFWSGAQQRTRQRGNRGFRAEQTNPPRISNIKTGGWKNEKSLFVAAAIVAIATPVLADEVGVRAGPVGAGVTVGEPRDHDRDREGTVIKEREPHDSKTVIKKEDADGDRSKTVIHHDN